MFVLVAVVVVVVNAYIRPISCKCVSGYVEQYIFCAFIFQRPAHNKNQTRWYSTFRYVVYWLI